MINVLGISVSSIVLIWVGYSLFFGQFSPIHEAGKTRKYRGNPGEPHVCPVCSIKMSDTEQLKSMIFPSIKNGGQLMLIRGCLNCLKHHLPRKCPVCKSRLSMSDYLISRMTERSSSRHAHVIGCNHCSRTGSLTKGMTKRSA